MSDCLFCKIVAGEIPCYKVYEDDSILAVKDINPKARVHILVIPKKHITSLQHVTDEDQSLLGDLTLKLHTIASLLGLDDGFKIAINTGEAGGQEVYHLHYHLLSGHLRI